MKVIFRIKWWELVVWWTRNNQLTHPLAELGGGVINCSLSTKTIYKIKNIDIYWLFRKYSQIWTKSG